MAPRPTRIIVSALTRKGFAEEEYGDHKKLRLYVDGERTRIHTRYSHGARECDDYILGQMAIQLRLSRAQLNDLMDCAISGEAYVEMLRERGEIKS
ncbi:MAG: hypothetical protein LBC63_02565 [Holophagales bacterium]|jgi:hypothetical protein|nr:hypothetical protein [Holophagales bacterium]